MKTRPRASRPGTFYSRAARQEGIALITALVTLVITFALVLLISNLVLRDNLLTVNDTSATRLAQIADGNSERARLLMVENYKRSRLNLTTWLDFVSSCRGSANCPNTPAQPETRALAGKHADSLSGATVAWQIVDVSAPNSGDAWIKIASTASDARGSQTVLRKVTFGENNIFDFAVLTDKTNCLFCHLTVNGDVGSTGFFRPGRGNEGIDGKNTGDGSQINGDVVVAQSTDPTQTSNITQDVRSDHEINGATVSGSILDNYTGNRLPRDTDGDGIPDFPGLDRDLARRSANGTIVGGEMYGVPIGGKISKIVPGTMVGSNKLGSVNKTYDGNLVLIGTNDNPIRLDRDIFVTGDVVLKGVITGRGAIYAGRNMYLAGNLTNKLKGDKPGKGLCAGMTDPNACAKANISANRDETRLAAINNIVMGSYTEQDDKNNVESYKERQAADFFRSQFGLRSCTQKFVHKGNSEEVRKVKGRFVDSVGRVVPDAEVQTYGDCGNDPYKPIMAPGTTDAGGNFVPWLSDDQYDTINGTEDLDHNTWRTNVYPENLPGKTSQEKINALTQQLINAGLPGPATAGSGATNWAYQIASNLIKAKAQTAAYSGADQDGNFVSGSFKTDGINSVRVAVNQTRAYKTESVQVDAFLYANSRVAGKFSGRGGHINGGMIGREIGLLAPGKTFENDFYTYPLARSDRDAYHYCHPGTNDITEDSSKSGGQCGYAINYDYRLRNGGYGYNLIKGVLGGTQEWQLDQDGSRAVKP